MYNTNLKDTFTKQYTTKKSMREACASVFEAIEKYETQWDSDICTQDAATLEPVLDDVLGMRASSKHMRLSILQDYVKWCIETGVPGATDGILHVRADGLEKMRRQTVKNPRHLQLYLDSICSPEKMETVDNLIRGFYWLAYSGMHEEDIVRVTALDIDLRYMEVRFAGVSYPLYRESLPAIRNCMELTQFLYLNPNYGSDKIVYKERAPGDKLLRGLKGDPSIAGIRSTISRRSKKMFEGTKDHAPKTDLRLSYYRVWLSGIFYRAYENEIAGVTPDFMDVAFEFMDGKEYRLESGRNTRSAKQRALAKEFRTDYDRWKQTLAIKSDP